jgi:hypothetical protein
LIEAPPLDKPHRMARRAVEFARRPVGQGRGAHPVLGMADGEVEPLGIGAVERFRDLLGPERAEAGVEPDLLHRHRQAVERADAPEARGQVAGQGRALGLRQGLERQEPRRRKPAAIGHRLEPEERVCPHVAPPGPHVIARALPPLDQTALRHHGQRLAQRHHRDAVRLGHAPLGRQARARGETARADVDRQALGDAEIGGQGARIGLGHGGCGGHAGPGLPSVAARLLYH